MRHQGTIGQIISTSNSGPQTDASSIDSGVHIQLKHDQNLGADAVSVGSSLHHEMPKGWGPDTLDISH